MPELEPSKGHSRDDDLFVTAAQEVQRAVRRFSDVMSDATTVFLAGDATGTQRQNDAAYREYVKSGETFLAMAKALKGASDRLQPAGPGPRGVDTQFAALVAQLPPRAGLTTEDKTRMLKQITPELQRRGVPTQHEIASAITTFERFGQRLATPLTAHMRFVFVDERPVLE